MAFTQSMLWTTNGTGDGPSGGYARDRWAELFRTLFANGVVKGEGGELRVSGTTSPLTVASGAVVIDGIFARDPSGDSVTVPTPSVGTTGKRLVVRADWTTQTVRLVLLSNSDGVPLSTQVPALMENSGTTWDIPLCRFDITTGGQIINLLDERQFAEARGAMPVGSVIPFAGAVAPAGWLLCDGSAVSRTTYAALFAVIGTTYGAGDGSTTFNLPNLKGRIPVGRDTGQTEFDTLGETGGAKTHTLSFFELPSHTHGAGTLAAGSAGGHSHTAQSAGSHSHTIQNRDTDGTGTFVQNRPDAGTAQSVTTDAAGDHTHTTDTQGEHTHTVSGFTAGSGGGQAHNNLQPYIVLNYLIKY